MAKGVDGGLGKNRGLTPVNKVDTKVTRGSYGTSDRGRSGGTGGTVYPTVLEAYNRDSDYKRWRSGQALYQGVGQGWDEIEERFLLRPIIDDGTSPGVRPLSLTSFPSSSAPDSAWTVACRHRGALMLPQPLAYNDIELDQQILQPERHRLHLDVSATLSSAQLSQFRSWIGEQFEDGATGLNWPADLITEIKSTVVAFTLLEVDVDLGRLTFDLSKPYTRRWINNRSYWSPVRYDPKAPAVWRSDGARYLISSNRYFCNCPDHSGTLVADLTAQVRGQGRFPRPSAGRTMANQWEKQQVGYSRRWRDLSYRVDQRRECKHIHAQRWSMGFPFDEPSDYEAGGREVQLSGATPIADLRRAVANFYKKRDLSLDQFIPALAAVSGLQLYSRDRLEDGSLLEREDGELVLWTTEREPDSAYTRTGDWWIEKGGSKLYIYDGNGFRTEVVTSNGFKSVLEEVDSFGALL